MNKIIIKGKAPTHRNQVAREMFQDGTCRSKKFGDRRNKRTKERSWQKEEW